MSFTLIIATSQQAVMLGDYRRTHIDDDNIHFDDTPKVFPLSDYVIGGFTGDLSATVNLRRTVKIKPNMKFTNVLKALEKALQGREKDIQQSVILVGQDKKGNMKIGELSHQNNFKSKVITVRENEIKWHYSFAYVDPSEYLNKHFANISEINQETLVEFARNVHQDVEKQDIRVSKKHDVLSFEVQR